MRVISRKTLRQFWEKAEYADAEQPLKAWFREASLALWKTSADVRGAYRHASVVGKSRVVFNIAGNKYRLIVKVNYTYGIIYIRFIGTHRDYDRVYATEI